MPTSEEMAAQALAAAEAKINTAKADSEITKSRPTTAAQSDQEAPPDESASGTTLKDKVGAPEKPKGPTENKFIESWRGNQETKLSDKTREALIGRLKKRYDTTRDIASKSDVSKDQQLTVLEKMLLASGEQILERFKNGEQTEQDLHLAWFAIQDEMQQKMDATGVMARERKGHFYNLRNSPFLSWFINTPQTELTSVENRYTTLFLEQIRAEWIDPQRLENDLRELNDLRVAIIHSVSPSGFRDERFDMLNLSSDPLIMHERSGVRYHNEIVNERDRILREQHGGVSYIDLHRRDPYTARRVHFEASQRALSNFAAKSGELFLRRPDLNVDAIDSAIGKIREDKPKQEDISELQEKSDVAAQKFEETKNRKETLKTQLETARNEIPTLERRLATARATWEAQETNLNREIGTLETRITAQEGMITVLPAGATSAEVTEHSKNMAKISENIRILTQQLSAKNDTRNRLLSEYASAEGDLLTAQGNIKKLNKEIIRIEKSGGDLETAKAAKKTAEDELNKKKKEVEENALPQEKKEQIDSLEKWKKPTEDYNKIMAERISASEGKRFGRATLANNNLTAEEQLVGAEAIREHIFNMVQDGKYSPEMARKMLSDETIAEAIIWVYQLDTSRIIGTGRPTIRETLASIQGVKLSLENEKRNLATTADPVIRTNIENNITNYQTLINETGRNLCRAVLPSLTGSQVKTAELINFLIEQGIRSARDGKPYLDLGRSDEFVPTSKETLQPRIENIVTANMGRIEFDRDGEGNRTRGIWEGEIPDCRIREFHTDIPTHARITQIFDRDQVQYAIQIQTNDRLYQSLPEIAPPGIPNLLREVFYDNNGRLRTETRQGERQIPRWYTLQTNAFNELPGGRDATIRMLNELGTISPSIPRMITSSTVDAVTRIANQERHGILRGLPVQIPVTGIPLTENPAEIRNYQIDIENGEFYITDTGTNRRLDLNRFYQQRFEECQQALGVKSLNEIQRQNLQNELLNIQEALGKQILIAQQRR